MIRTRMIFSGNDERWTAEIALKLLNISRKPILFEMRLVFAKNII